MGLMGAADLQDPSIRSSFYDLWQLIDAEAHLRTEGWAPPGAADDERLNQALNDLQAWASRLSTSDLMDRE